MLNFLNLKPEAFGLDISDLSLKIVFPEKRKNYINSLYFYENKIPPEIVEDGEIKNEKKLVEKIKETLKNGRIKSKYVIASLPEKKAFLEIIQMPKLTEEELKSAIIYEAENYIPFPVHDVYLDYQIIPPVYESTKEVNVLLVAAPKKIVNSYFSAIKMAGLFPLAFEIESLAIARALIKDGISHSPIILINLGASKTTFIIFSGYSVRFSFSTPISSSTFTKTIAKTLCISFSEAEKIKIKHGLEEKIKLKIKDHKSIFTHEKGKIFEALIPPLVDLVQQIKKCIAYYKSHSKDVHLAPTEKGFSKIILCGGGANLKGLSAFLSLELELPVDLGNPLVNFPPIKNKTLNISHSEILKYTTALGLALRSIQQYD